MLKSVIEEENICHYSDLDLPESFQSEVDRATTARNRRSIEAFSGLSLEQMHAFLSFPFDSGDLIRVSDKFAPPSEVPVLNLYNLLAEALKENGLKTTAKGNLSRIFREQSILP